MTAGRARSEKSCLKRSGRNTSPSISCVPSKLRMVAIKCREELWPSHSHARPILLRKRIRLQCVEASADVNTGPSRPPLERLIDQSNSRRPKDDWFRHGDNPVRYVPYILRLTDDRHSDCPHRLGHVPD